MRGSAIVWVVALHATICAPSAFAEDLDGIRAKISRFTNEVTELEQKYLAPAILERQYEFAARLSDGQLFFVRRDYPRAAMVLLDLVERPASKGHPGYGEARYYLAESLFQARNPLAAAKYFDEIAESGTRTQRHDAVGRLLEIALATRDEAAAERYLSRAEALLGSAPEPSLLYAVAKYHYRSDNLERAAGLFGRVPADSVEGLRSQYFIGVIRVRQGQLDVASPIFDRLTEMPVEVEGQDAAARRRVINLARMAKARIHYERGQFAEAVGAYAAVPRTDESFDEALYESVWISIKQEDYERALRKLEVQLISQPDVLQGPDTRLLQGKLLMMLGRYDEAGDAFQEVLYEFGPVHEEMHQVVRASGSDLEGHFHRLIGRNVAEFELTTFLPESAAKVAGSDIQADRALTLVNDLAVQKKDVVEAQRTIKQLEAALSADNRVEIFGPLHQGWLRAIVTRGGVARARGELNEVAGRGVKDPTYAGLRKTRSQWAERFDRIPPTSRALEARDQAVDEQMLRIDREAYKLEIELQSLEAQLRAVDQYVDTAARRRGLPTKEETGARARVELELETAKSLRAHLEELQGYISSERVQVGVNDYASRQDDMVRRQYLQAVELERRWLDENGRKQGAAERQQLDAIDTRVLAYMDRSRALVDERVTDVRRQLDIEAKNVAQYDGELLTFQGQTESLGGAIAARSFQRVLDRVDAVVLSADVGLIDVTWQRKEDKSGQIYDMLGRQRLELEQLDRDFGEVSRE